MCILQYDMHDAFVAIDQRGYYVEILVELICQVNLSCKGILRTQ